MISVAQKENRAIVWLDEGHVIMATSGAVSGSSFLSRVAPEHVHFFDNTHLERYDEAAGWCAFPDLTFMVDQESWRGPIREQHAPGVEYACVITRMSAVNGGLGGHMVELGWPAESSDHDAILDSMDRSVIFLNLEGEVTYRNRKAARSSLEKGTEPIGRPVWDGLDWRNLREERESLIRLFRLAVQSGEVQTLILRQGRRFSSSERSIIQVAMSPVKNREGQVEQVVMEEWHIPVDVQMDIRSRMTESAFRSFLEQSPLPAWMVDAQGKLIALSRIYADLFGLGNDDIGKDMMQLIPSRFVMQYTKHHEKVLNSGENLHVVENWMGLDSKVRTYIVHKFPIRTGPVITMIGAISFEVTEKLRMEEEFKESHERFTLASEATQDLIWDWDINADRVRTQGDPEVIWTDEEEVVYSSMRFFGKMHPDDRERVENLVRSALSEPSVDRIQDIYRFRIQGDHYVHILDRARILRDEHGRPYRVVGSAMRIAGDQQRILRMLPIVEEKTPHMVNASGMTNDMKWTGGEHLEQAVRRLLAKADPLGRISAGLSISGLDRIIMEGYSMDPLLTVVARFLDTVNSSSPVRNLSLYIWNENGKVWLRAAHDGAPDWEAEMKAWGLGKQEAGQFEEAFTGRGHVMFSFTIPVDTKR